MELRLQKVLAQAGISSRRKAEELISAGRVEVNGQIVRELGTKVDPSRDLVRVDGRLVSERQQRVYYVLYKPSGVVTTFSDPQGRPTIRDLVKNISERVFAVGRLDYDAEGALVITNDGDLAHKLMHPSFEVPRTYLVKVKGTPDEATLEKLRSGVRLEDGMAKPLSVEVHTEAERNTWLQLTVAEGRPHLVKRLVEAVGHPALRLYRPQYGGVSAEGLRPGQSRQLSSMEVDALKRVAEGRGTVEAPPTPWRLPPRRHGHGGEEDWDEGDRPRTERAPVRRAPARRSEERASRSPERTTRRPERTPRAERPVKEESIGVGVTRRATTRPRADVRPRRFDERPEGTRAPRGEGRERGGFQRRDETRGPRREAGERGGFQRRDETRGPRREAGSSRSGGERAERGSGGRFGGRSGGEERSGGRQGPRSQERGAARGGGRSFEPRSGPAGKRPAGGRPGRPSGKPAGSGGRGRPGPGGRRGR